VRSDCPFGPGLCDLLTCPAGVHEAARELDTETGIGHSVPRVELELGVGEASPSVLITMPGGLTMNSLPCTMSASIRRTLEVITARVKSRVTRRICV